MTCWMFWRDPEARGGYHRCGEGENHDGLHACCCGAVSEHAERTPEAPPDRAAAYQARLEAKLARWRYEGKIR
jgi:hypothetical protein